MFVDLNVAELYCAYITKKPVLTTLFFFLTLHPLHLLPHSRGWGWCLDDAPVKDKLSLNMALPGVLYSATHQCRLQYGSGSLLCGDMDVRLSIKTNTSEQSHEQLCKRNVRLLYSCIFPVEISVLHVGCNSVIFHFTETMKPLQSYHFNKPKDKCLSRR